MRRKVFTEEPLSYWEESSYMMVLPPNDKAELLKIALMRIETMPEIEVKEQNYHVDRNCFTLQLEYEEETYEVGCYIGGLTVPEYYVDNALFSESEKKQILNTKTAITLFMKFNHNAKKCYHLQLKLAVAMLPDLIGVLDESAEKMLAAKWVKMVAQSHVLPSAKHLFSVQAIMNKHENVWLHTHGLNRCGITELEIVNSDKENQQNHFRLINAYAMHLIDKKEPFDPRHHSAYIGQLVNGYPIVVTCRSWTTGIMEYKKLTLGGLEDRKKGHNSFTSLIFLYKSEQDEQHGILSKVSIYDKWWEDNPLFFFSDQETARMKALAIEQFHYVKEIFPEKSKEILIKIGLYSEKEKQYEHIWFELLEIKEELFRAKLTQEPYYFDDMHVGYEGWYKKEDITDWIIYTNNLCVTPDNAFLLDE